MNYFPLFFFGLTGSLKDGFEHEMTSTFLNIQPEMLFSLCSSSY